MMMVSNTITNTMPIFYINQASLGFHLHTPLSPLMIIIDIVGRWPTASDLLRKSESSCAISHVPHMFLTCSSHVPYMFLY